MPIYLVDIALLDDLTSYRLPCGSEVPCVDVSRRLASDEAQSSAEAHRLGCGQDMAAGAGASISRGAQKHTKSAAVGPQSNLKNKKYIAC